MTSPALTSGIVLYSALGGAMAMTPIPPVGAWAVILLWETFQRPLKKKFPNLSVTLSDISPQALSIAKQNAEANEVDVAFLEGDLLDPFSGQKAHYFICNPPYVSVEEYAALDPEVRNFEPQTALVSGPSGLEFYERLQKNLPNTSTQKPKSGSRSGTVKELH